MKIRKTRNDERETYIYRFSDGTKVELNPGEDGVTEVDIKKLHALDDSEVYYNNKNLRPEKTEEEKAEIEKWKLNFITTFRERHGYEPIEDIVKGAVEERFPKNYNLSLDFDNDGDIDPDKRLIATIKSKDMNEEFEWSEHMENILSLLTDKQRLVIKLMFVDGYKQSKIADLMNISSAAVKKHLDKAKEIIKNNF
ncbi:MAG: sigma-70 family RNA polymerase sigma factor [Peptoniphilus harei]|uniref:RNA polymerase sigma factor n=1 Tax=Peptoniphilus harei TaxID=54005 RepID=UPI002903D6FD|nr:sigma-70 family RNA polymerase sigma factor [Peptoniphilus harei]MDU2373447.1 sigma-70 family RNA polymerase sigma factor [Peptoniphilus harei]